DGLRRLVAGETARGPKVHVLAVVGDAGRPRRLVLRAHAVNRPPRDEGGARLGKDEHREPVREHLATDAVEGRRGCEDGKQEEAGEGGRRLQEAGPQSRMRPSPRATAMWSPAP